MNDEDTKEYEKIIDEMIDNDMVWILYLPEKHLDELVKFIINRGDRH